METFYTSASLVFVKHPVPPSGGSLEIGNGLGVYTQRSPLREVPPSGGSLEIGNSYWTTHTSKCDLVPPSGGSLEIGNRLLSSYSTSAPSNVPPSGGSLEIGNVEVKPR